MGFFALSERRVAGAISARSSGGARGMGGLAAALGLAASFASVSCSSAGGNNAVGSGGSGNAGGFGGVGFGGSSAAGGSINVDGSSGGGGIGGKLNQEPPCPGATAQSDTDGDGFTTATGDCNDCTDQMNPAAYDYPQNNIDEDCNGTKDDEPANCDTNPVDIGYGDPFIAAQAIGLCRRAQGASWGLVSAKYAKADGSAGMHDLSRGLLPNFGPNVNPREGVNILVLSSGTARRPSDPGFRSPVGEDPANIFNVFDMNTTGGAPAGFPLPAPSCPNQQAGTAPIANDPAALELVIRTPTNANAFSFDFSFYTYEFPQFICSEYNDFFVALVNPPPPNAQESNVSFDSQGNPVSVNNGFLEVCAPQQAGGKNFTCPQGTAMLSGTGFDEQHPAYGGPHAATGWLVTTAPVPPRTEITIRFAIWDAGDHILNSTVLIDNMHWDIVEGDFPVTTPVPR